VRAVSYFAYCPGQVINEQGLQIFMKLLDLFYVIWKLVPLVETGGNRYKICPQVRKKCLAKQGLCNWNVTLLLPHV
jgi:hypothetical protein